MDSLLPTVTRRKVHAISHPLSEGHSKAVVEELKNVGLYKGLGSFETEEVAPCNWCMETFKIKKTYKMKATYFVFYVQNKGRVLTQVSGEAINTNTHQLVFDHPMEDCPLVQRKLFNVFVYGNDINLDKEILLRRRLSLLYMKRIINRYVKHGVGRTHFDHIMRNPIIEDPNRDVIIHVFDSNLTVGEIERFVKYYHQQRKAYYESDSKKCDSKTVRFNLAFSLLNDCKRMNMVADYSCDILAAHFPAYPERSVVDGVTCYHGTTRLYNCIAVCYALSKYYDVEINIHLREQHVCDCLNRPVMPLLPMNGSILEQSPYVSLDNVCFQLVF